MRIGALLAEYQNLVVFLAVGAVKTCVEAFAGRRARRGGEESSQAISNLFIAVGLLAPVLVVLEVVFLKRRFPLGWCVFFAAGQLVWMGLRVLAMWTLGPFYSVHVRIAGEHRLVRRGIYRYVRHPIYLVSMLEDVFYPLIAGAWLSMIVVVLLDVPATLLRRRQEEAALTERFGAEYVAYKEATWF
jgi:protein-S-isoprenylcysteine O-methyltransferase Ste14